ncbi:MAG: hypothetical protein ACRDIU_03905 [Actinomycetota bacterium]
MIIDCKQCEMFQSDHCKDCFVTAVLSRTEAEVVEIDPEEEPAIDNLQQAGLAPILKFKRRAG